MKTIALTLLFVCFGAWAQSPPDTDDDSAKRDALLHALHQAEGGSASNAANADAAPVTASTNSVPATPDAQPAPRHKRRNSAADAAVTVINATNTVIVNASTNPVIVAGATNNPVVIAAPPAAAAPLAAPGAVIPGATAVVPQPGLPGGIPGGPAAPAAFPQPRSTAQAAPANPFLRPPPAREPEPIVRAGEIDFHEVPLEQFLDVYAKLVHRTILAAPNLPQAKITLQTETDLTQTRSHPRV